MFRLIKNKEVTVKRYFLGVMVVLFLALTVTVFAYGPRALSGQGGFGPGSCGGTGPCVEGQGGASDGPISPQANLNLSEEQIGQMRQARETFQKNTQDLPKQLFQKRLEMRGLYTDPNANEMIIRDKQKELNALQQNMVDKMAEFRLEQRKILTPDQLKKLSETQVGRGFGRMRPKQGPGGACGQCPGSSQGSSSN